MAFKTFFKIADANAEISRLNTEVANAQTALETAKTEHASALQSVQAQVTERDTQISTLTGERDSARTDLEARNVELQTLRGESKNADEKAADILAGVGVQKPIEGSAAETKTKEQLWQEYHTLPMGDARNEFFKANRAAMTA